MITDESKQLLLLLYYDRGILKKEIRSYEVSLWTLQDEFITVLKWSDAEQTGRIEKPIMTLNVDGTLNLSFSIPMYVHYYIEGTSTISAHLEKRENPIWYNTRNGNLMINLRKIKVIFNKLETEEEVYEFLITKITEDHEGDILTCNIECEGLAFHELGKRGYKINLSEDLYLSEEEEWNKTKTGDPPKENIDFWCGEKGMKLDKWINGEYHNPTIWYYKVLMNWNSFANDNNGLLRASNKIYEEPYTSDWNDNLLATEIVSYKEKERPVQIENSNIYNGTLTIAEAFGVHCRYEYGHDENYHINSRTIVFYNNFTQEDNIFLLSYPHSSSRVSRTMESDNLTTKLYVLDVENANNIIGYNSITNTPANPTLEDYILNFDYLYQTLGITEELYKEIQQFEIDIRRINKELIPLYNKLNKYASKKPEIEGKLAFYINSQEEAQKLIDFYNAKLELLDSKDSEQDGMISVKEDHPDSSFIKKDKDDQYYIDLTLTNKGIAPETVKIYRNLNIIAHTLNTEVTNFYFDYDEYGNIIHIRGILPIGENNKVYLIYKYRPEFYYKSIMLIWINKMNEDEKNSDYYGELLAEVSEELITIEQNLEDKLNEKQELIRSFEHMMGPALREGYWQPEDYKDYGSNFTNSKNIPTAYSPSFYNMETGSNFEIGWDNILFDQEQGLSYKSSIELTTTYYPCINLRAVFGNNIKDLSEYSFIFNKYHTLNGDENKLQYLHTFKIGSEALLRFVKNNNNEIIPVLVLVGAKSMQEDEISYMIDPTKGHPRIGIFNPQISANNTIIVGITDATSITNGHWLIGANVTSSNYQIVYPRIKFTSLDLNPYTISVSYNNQLLEEYKDYSLLTRINNDQDEYGFTGTGILETLVSIKPEVIFKARNFVGPITISYTISNANTEIYLDALNVSKENAWPKVSYEVTPTILNPNLSKTLYTRLAQLVMINDADLKFENTFGYISAMTLDLDDVLNDTIEVKNYKTKFEDLFSNIVALTENMKANEQRFAAAIGGNVPLSPLGFTESLNNIQNINFLDNYLDNYFDSSQFVDDKLAALFTEAGSILSHANSTLNSITSLTVNNSNILQGLAENVAQNLTVTVYKQENRPDNFKVGDIWVKTKIENLHEVVDGRYLAVMNSSDIVYEEGDSPYAGFMRTYNGSVANITGANINIDAVAGTIKLEAENEIELASGGDIDIAANCDVNIHGNESVNIGGTTINIGSTSANGNDYGGINLIASSYEEFGTKAGNASYTLVSIKPTKIFMAASVLEMKAASTINLYASTGTVAGTSAIKIDANEGIWIGSGKSLTLFSGATGTGASVELNKDHLLLGYGNVSSLSTSASAMEFTKDYIILAVGKNISSSTNVTGLSGGLVGAKLTKDSIGLATITNAIVMNGSGITLGSWSSGNSAYDLSSSTIGSTILGENKGSYVHIAGDGLTIASGGNLYINAANFKVNTNSSTVFAVGNSLGTLALVTAYTNNTAGTWVTNWTSGIIYNSNGLFVRGSGIFNGDITATSLIANSSVGTFKATGNTLGFYNGNNPIFTISSGLNSTDITVFGNLQLGAGGSFAIDVTDLMIINSTNLVINPNPTSGNPYFRLGPSSNALMSYDGNSLNINADVFKLSSTNFGIDSSATGTNSIIYMANAATWANATLGLRFSLTDGLEVKGTISADNIYGGTISSANNVSFDLGYLHYTPTDGLYILADSSNPNSEKLLFGTTISNLSSGVATATLQAGLAASDAEIALARADDALLNANDALGKYNGLSGLAEIDVVGWLSDLEGRVGALEGN